MNKASRIICSAALTAVLALGGTALTAGTAFADKSSRTNHGSSYYHGYNKDGHDSENCKVIRVNGRVVVICKNPHHKQRQG